MIIYAKYSQKLKNSKIYLNILCDGNLMNETCRAQYRQAVKRVVSENMNS